MLLLLDVLADVPSGGGRPSAASTWERLSSPFPPGFRAAIRLEAKVCALALSVELALELDAEAAWVALLADAAPACNCCSKSALSKGKEKDCDGSCGPRGAGFAEPSALAEPLA